MLRGKKTWSVLLVLVLAVSLLAGCGGGQSKDTGKDAGKAAESTWERVQKEGKIVFGLDDAFRPMGFRDENNQLVGFDIDMANEMGKRLGIEFVPQPTPWDGVTAALNAKKFDLIISGMTITDERKKEVLFTDPYIKAGQMMVVLADNNTIKGKEDLKGKVVGTQKGSSSQPLVEAMTDLKDKKFYDQFPEALMDLKNKRIDCLVADATLVADVMRNQPGQFKSVGMLEEEYFGIAARKSDKELVDKLNQVLKEMKEDGTMKKLSEKWFGMDVTSF